MSYQLLAVIALLCQVHGTYGSKSVAMTGSTGYRDDKVVELEFSYAEASKQQLKCQKYFINCTKNGRPLEDCILERK